MLDLLKHNTYNIRLRARFELSSRDTDDVIKATKAWLKKNKEPGAQLEGHIGRGHRRFGPIARDARVRGQRRLQTASW